MVLLSNQLYNETNNYVREEEEGRRGGGEEEGNRVGGEEEGRNVGGRD